MQGYCCLETFQGHKKVRNTKRVRYLVRTAIVIVPQKTNLNTSIKERLVSTGVLRSNCEKDYSIRNSKRTLRKVTKCKN